MSHEIDTMMSVRTRPWHFSQTADRTNILPEYPENWDEARRAAGILWEPRKAPLYCGAYVLQRGAELPEGHEVVAELPDGARVAQELVPEFSAVERDDTGARIASIPTSLPLISHAQMGELFEAFTAAGDGKTVFETAGSLRGGANVWGLLRLDEPFEVAGDSSATYPYLVVMNSHDGKGACKAQYTNVRVVCWNTWNAADVGSGSEFAVTIRHSGDTDAKIEDAKQALAGLRANAEAYRVECEQLARISVSDEIAEDFTDWFIPMPDGASERQRNSRNTKRARFLSLYNGESLKGEWTQADITGNAYGLVQAVGEWLDHERDVRGGRDSYLSRTILSPQRAKRDAVDHIRELVSASN